MQEENRDDNTMSEAEAAYDKWFCAKIQQALDDPRPSIPHEEVVASSARLRAELLQKANKQ